MDKEEKDSINYRFSGYQLPKVQLDATGDAYVVLKPHPYYYNQPAYWTPAYLRYTPPGNLKLSQQTYPLLDL